MAETKTPNSINDSCASSDDDEFFEVEAVNASESSVSPSASSSSPPSFNQISALSGKDILPKVTINSIGSEEQETILIGQPESLSCDPLSLHLLKLTRGYASDETEDTDVGTASSIEGGNVEDIRITDRRKKSTKSRLSARYEQDEDAKSDANSITAKTGSAVKSKVKAGFKKVTKVGRNVLREVKTAVSSQTIESGLVSDQSSSSTPNISSIVPPMNQLRLEVNHKKDSADFAGLKTVQELNDCRGAVWCMKWSFGGQLLAVAGENQLLRVYCCSKAWKYFTHLRNKASGQQISPSSTHEKTSVAGQGTGSSRSGSISSTDLNYSYSYSGNWADDSLSEEGPMLLFAAYRGHTADVLDISWSKNHFLLSSSMDKTVRLWHVTRVECLCTLRHTDFVTTISFHPKDDRYFLSGSLDGILRLWNIPDKRVALWNEVSRVVTKGNQQNSADTSSSGIDYDRLITASAFVQNGKFAVIGTYDGRVIFYNTNNLQYFTQLHVRPSPGITQVAPRGDPSKLRKNRKSNKVTGIESVCDNKILVTTNDSRIRLYDLRDLSLACKYKGYVNESLQIRASVSHDQKYILCGSEDSSFYIWRLQQNSGSRKDPSNSWESYRIPNSSAGSEDQASVNPTPTLSIITAATFAPAPKTLCPEAEYVIMTADFQGVLRLFAK